MKKLSALAFLVLLPASISATDGQKLYENFCLKCHGVRGRGDGKASVLFDPKPTNFTDPTWRNKMTDDQIFDAIKMGKKASKIKVGRKMPAFGKRIADNQIRALVRVVGDFGAPKNK